MRTDEENLKRLLEIPVENGWKDIVSSLYYQKFEIRNHSIYITAFEFHLA